MTLIYYLTYLCEFRASCDKFFDKLPRIKQRNLSPSEFASRQTFEDFNPVHEIRTHSSIFFNKIGRYAETE